MGKTKFKWRTAGFEEIRRSPEAVALLEGNVSAAADAAGPGYVGSVVQGLGRGTLGRAIGTVFTGDFKAILDNSRKQTLMRVFDRLGG
jgi:hypothetical protein